MNEDQEAEIKEEVPPSRSEPDKEDDKPQVGDLGRRWGPRFVQNNPKLETVEDRYSYLGKFVSELFHNIFNKIYLIRLRRRIVSGIFLAICIFFSTPPRCSFSTPIPWLG